MPFVDIQQDLHEEIKEAIKDPKSKFRSIRAFVNQAVSQQLSANYTPEVLSAIIAGNEKLKSISGELLSMLQEKGAGSTTINVPVLVKMLKGKDDFIFIEGSTTEILGDIKNIKNTDELASIFLYLQVPKGTEEALVTGVLLQIDLIIPLRVRRWLFYTEKDIEKIKGWVLLGIKKEESKNAN